MENILVGIIVTGALLFCIKSVVRIYRGDGGCNCGINCQCTSPDRQGRGCTGIQPFNAKDRPKG